VEKLMDIRLIFANFGLCTLLIFAVWAAPRGDTVLVISSPFESNAARMNRIAQADGRIVSAGRYEWIIVAYSTNPDFPSRLMKAGALVVLNENLAVGCKRGENGFFGKTS